VSELAKTLTGWLRKVTCPLCGETASHLHSTAMKAVYECDGPEHHCFEARKW
jgi:hypothetical protein